MSCTFWNMRRRQAAQKLEKPVEPEVVQPEPEEPEQLEIEPETDGTFTEIADAPAEAPKKARKSKVKSDD